MTGGADVRGHMLLWIASHWISELPPGSVSSVSLDAMDKRGLVLLHPVIFEAARLASHDKLTAIALVEGSVHLGLSGRAEALSAVIRVAIEEANARLPPDQAAAWRLSPQPYRQTQVATKAATILARKAADKALARCFPSHPLGRCVEKLAREEQARRQAARLLRQDPPPF